MITHTALGRFPGDSGAIPFRWILAVCHRNLPNRYGESMDMYVGDSCARNALDLHKFSYAFSSDASAPTSMCVCVHVCLCSFGQARKSIHLLH